jgi:hypothetical protein
MHDVSAALVCVSMNRRDELVLTQQDVDRAYKEAIRAVGMMRGTIPDETRQLMADAVREFYRLLEERIQDKNANMSSAF